MSYKIYKPVYSILSDKKVEKEFVYQSCGIVIGYEMKIFLLWLNEWNTLTFPYEDLNFKISLN